MKQKGDIWKGPEGQCHRKYLPEHLKAQEIFGQKIVEEALKLEQLLVKKKTTIQDLCMKVLEATPKALEGKIFTFYTFDKQHKIEVDTKAGYVRVYESLKENPGHKDYRLVNTSLSSAVLPTTVAPESESENSGTLIFK